MPCSLVLVMALSGLGSANYAMARPGALEYPVQYSVAAKGAGYTFPEHVQAFPLQYQNGIVPVDGQRVQRGGWLGGYDSSSNACRDIVKSTIVSFIIGRDSDVMTAKEIECRWNAGGYQYGYSYGY